MSGFQGKFIWYELMTPDATGAEAFYKSVVGWGTRDAGMPDMAYTLLTVGDAGPVGGLMALSKDCGADVRPGWIGHVAVGDVDGMADRVTKAGGTIRHAPQDVPGIGRFAVVTDPQGAAFVLFHGTGTPPAQPPAPGTPGYIGWHELSATDWEAAFAFYSDLFGWTKSEAIDMGPMGTYQLFAVDGVPVGGMMNKRQAAPVPHWLFYFIVEAIDAAVARVTAAGGQIIHGPVEVPGGSWIVNGHDPQGVLFALVAPHR